MSDFENKYVYTYPLQPLFYGHFIDDGFFIWQHGLMELIKFLHHLNSVSNSINSPGISHPMRYHIFTS